MATRDPLEPGGKSRSPRVVRSGARSVDELPRFDGFPKGGDAFFQTLAKKQDREWFQAHKGEYEALWQLPMTSLLHDLRAALDGAYPMVSESTPKVFRVYRDTRFSKDKTPYKTNCAGSLSLSGGSAMTGTGLYVQLGLEADFIAIGRWMFEKDDLENFRAAVASDAGAVLAKKLTAAEKRGFTLVAHETLKRVPAPYEAEHPRAALLKLKGLALRLPPPAEGLTSSRKFLTWIAKEAKAIAGIVEWLDDAVG